MGNMVLRTQQECEDLVRGLCFMATGGGGRQKEGLKLLLDELEAGREMEWVDVDSLPDEAWTATVAGIGGRAREGGTEEELAELGCVEEKYASSDEMRRVVPAVEVLQDYTGVKLQAIVPGEMGGWSVPRAIAAALELGVPVVDGDYSGGRAKPEISQGIPAIRGVPVLPMFLVTRWGDVVIVKDAVSAAMADRIARMITLASYGALGCSYSLMQIKDVKEVLAAGTVTKAFQVGQVIREAREKGVDPVAKAVKAVDGWLLFEGEITATEIADEQSYAWGLGTHKLRGLGSHEGHTFSIWYKNEYHMSWRDDEPFVTSPDSMVMVELKTGEPRRSFDFSVGDQVAIVGCKAHEFHRTREGIEALGPRHFGFDFDYVPIEERLKEFGL